MSADDDKAKQLVIDVLASDFIKKLDFGFGEVRVKPDMYKSVRDAVRDGKIGVIVAPEMMKRKEAALYFPELKFPDGGIVYDLLVFRVSGFSNTTSAISIGSQIVHECTHAGFDVLKRKKMTRHQGEAAAYIAQGIVMYEMAAQAKIPVPKPATKVNEAMKAVVELKSKTNISKDIINLIYADLVANPDVYTDGPLVNDGVGRAYSPPPKAGTKPPAKAPPATAPKR